MYFLKFKKPDEVRKHVTKAEDVDKIVDFVTKNQHLIFGPYEEEDDSVTLAINGEDVSVGGSPVILPRKCFDVVSKQPSVKAQVTAMLKKKGINVQVSVEARGGAGFVPVLDPSKLVVIVYKNGQKIRVEHRGDVHKTFAELIAAWNKI